ncbi:asparagine synthase (glutamine-hydrolyzing) [Aurantibacillus circumpalustris]|uniref:asparagine synthase (glutamine-hydrolyzing) n=1 Tax=Aurantibacillus circumpalustris TaxID=3036359 RepID=UPI00295B0A65|nr:asparagine synthase (glutamine-hydrolyzing) [Aurantibacillus circumpalustris]
MCGISILFNKNYITRELYTNFIESLQKINHRGPDDEGIVLINTNTGEYKITYSQIEGINNPFNQEVEKFDLALGHKRLSIIDLSPAGHQPMEGKEGSWIVFNGEIYNYIELRAELKLLGCNFKTASDTEVILEAYRIWGKDCLNKFNGMWSICLWDAIHKKLFISNDRFGVKPLYYKENADGFVLVSETKQLQAFRSIELKLNEEHIKDFADFGYVDHNENTIYQDVFRFKGSHYFLWNVNEYAKNFLHKHQVRYYQISQSKIRIEHDAAIMQFRELLNDAVKIRMRADVDFGFALSGGLDSSAILYSARNILKSENKKNELLGFSAVFPGYKEADESEYVKIVANDLPCKTIYAEVMNDFNIPEFEKHVYHQEEPLIDTSFLAQWGVYEKASKSGIKILFNGQGADEVFGGYHHHFYKYCRQLLVKGKLPEYFSLIAQYSTIKQIEKNKVHKIVFNELKLSALMKAGIKKFDHHLQKHWNRIDSLDEIMLKDFDTYQLPMYLRVDDRNSMAFSMESRHPFMDYRLVEFGYSLPNNFLIKDGWQKNILREAMVEMPQQIRYRKDKKGFTTPEEVWLGRYGKDFEEYLEYNKTVLGTRTPSYSKYRNYTLGAWFKVNGIVKR